MNKRLRFRSFHEPVRVGYVKPAKVCDVAPTCGAAGQLGRCEVWDASGESDLIRRNPDVNLAKACLKLLLETEKKRVAFVTLRRPGFLKFGGRATV